MASVEHVRVRAWYRIQATYKYLHVGRDFLKIGNLQLLKFMVWSELSNIDGILNTGVAKS